MHISILPIRGSLNMSEGGLLLTAALHCLMGRDARARQESKTERKRGEQEGEREREQAGERDRER